MKAYTKSQLQKIMGISATKLRTLMNIEYLTELQGFNYNQKQRILSPKIVKWILEEWGIEYPK